MILMIVVAALILGIAFYQVVQGLFSALVMALLSIIAAVVALNYYEPLANALAGTLGAYGHGVCLLALFVLPLLAMREICDRLIGGNLVLGVWADRLGGGALGLVSGMILAGMLMLTIQLLPLPGAFLGYQPFDARLAEEQAGPPMWATNFTMSLAKGFSANVLSPRGGSQSTLGHRHPDIALETFAARNRPEGGSAYAAPDALDVLGAWVVPVAPKAQMSDHDPAAQRDEESRQAILQTPLYFPLKASEGPSNKNEAVVVVRVRVDELARDEDGWFRLPATHFCLITSSGQQYYPVGYLTYLGQWKVNPVVEKPEQTLTVAKVGEIVVARPWTEKSGPKKLLVDWVYRLPGDGKGKPAEGQQPASMVFRGLSFAEVVTLSEGLPPVPDKQTMAALGLKSEKYKVAFAAPKPPPASQPAFRAVTMEVFNMTGRNKMHDELAMRLSAASTSPADPKMEVSGLGIRKINIARFPQGDLLRGPDNARVVGDYAVPTPTPTGTQPGQLVVQVMLAADPKLIAEPGAKGDMGRMRPQLMLDNGTLVPCRGTYVVWNGKDDGGKDKKMVSFHYDSTGVIEHLEDPFVEGVIASGKEQANKPGSGNPMGLVFVVEMNPDRSVVGLTFNIGSRYEFYPVKPLQCAR